MNPPKAESFKPSGSWQSVPDWAVLPNGGEYYKNGHTGQKFVRWNPPVPPPEAVIDKRTGKPQVVPSQEESSFPLHSSGQTIGQESEFNPGYVQSVTSEEEEEYAHGPASEQQCETTERYTKRRIRENKAAIFAEMEVNEKAQGQSQKKALGETKANDLFDENEERDWPKTLKATVLSGEELSTVVLPPRQIIIPEWFNEGDCGFIFAPRGLGKTWMNLGLAIAIATKGKFGPYASEVKWPVLYIDGEMPFEVMRQRIIALHGSVPQNLYFLSHEILFQQEQATLNLTDCSPQEAITDFCLAKDIRVVVLDNLSCLFSGLKENEADAWEPVKVWLLTLRRHRIAVIVVHHSGRNPNYMRGTTRREDDVFWVIRLEEPADAKVTPAPGARFITRFTKSRGAPGEPFSYDWKIEPEGDHSVRVTFAPTSSDDIIVSWVRDGLTDASDIAHEMGISKGMISRRATRLIDAGRLEKNGRHYALGPLEQADWHDQPDWTKKRGKTDSSIKT